MIKNGLPYIDGYKPRWNFQQMLEDKVLGYVSLHKRVENDFQNFANQEVEVKPTLVQFESWIDSPPDRTTIKPRTNNTYRAVKRNYLELEQKNRSVGLNGEQLVFDYEKWRLDKLGQPKLAKEVKWMSKDKGDGLGYDILSKNTNGEDIFIEVKSTTLGKETPIYFSKTENDFSNDNGKAFHLYRVFELKRAPKMFIRNGRFDEICSIETVTYRGIF